MELHYNSLPRQSYANAGQTATADTANTSCNGIRGSSTLTSSTSGSPSITDNNANPKQHRAVAFGKQINSLQYSLPYSASKSATNIYHHQLVLYQQQQNIQQQLQDPSSSTLMLASRSSPPPGHGGFPKQRGVSVPNLGFWQIKNKTKREHMYNTYKTHTLTNEN